MRENVDETGAAGRAARPAGLRAAAAFLLPVADDTTVTSSGVSAAGHWFVPIGLAVGAIYAAIFGGVWSIYGEYFGLRLLPAAAVLAADACFFGARLWRGACTVADETLFRRPALRQAIPPAVVLFVMLAAFKMAAMLGLPRGQAWVAGDWRRYLVIVSPQPVLRPLILMAVWGRWASLLALSLGRARADEEAALSGLMRAARLRVVLGWLIPCTALTAAYCGGSSNVAAGVLISSITLGVSYLVAVVLSWCSGGLSRASVYTAGLAGELGFLLAYIPFANRIYGW